MSDYVSVEWELPSGVLGRIFEGICPRALARCSCVAKAWEDVTKEDSFAKKLGLERAWRCGTVVTKCIEFPKNRSTQFDRCVMRGNMLAIMQWGAIVLVNVENGEVSLHSMESAWGWTLCLIDGMLLCDDTQRKVEVLEIPGFKRVASVVLSFEVYATVDVGEHMAIGGAGGGLELWSKAGWNRVKVLNDVVDGWGGEENSIRCAAFATEAGLLVCGLSCGDLEVWSLASCDRVATLKGHFRCVRRVDVNKNLMISCSMDGTVRIWVQETFQSLRVIHMDDYWLCGVVALSDNKFAHCGKSHLDVMIRDIAEGCCLDTLNVGGSFMGFFLTEDKLTVVRRDGKILVWDFFAHCSKE